MSQYIYDVMDELIDGKIRTYKGWIYKILNKNDDTYYYQFVFNVSLDGLIITEGTMSDFMNGDYLELSEDEKSKALVRKSKIK